MTRDTSASRPPRLADWLLHRLTSGPRQLSLIGDLHEQDRSGRSGAWYWRQTLRAIATTTVRDVRCHPLIAIRTIVLTYVFLIPWVFFTGYVYGTTRWWMIDHLLQGSVLLEDAWNRYRAPLLVAWRLGGASPAG